MKFTINTELLKNVCNLFTKNFPKSSIEELNGVLISVEGNFVVFKAKQFDFNLVYKIESESTQDGSIVIDIENLNTIINSILDSLITIELKKNMLSVKSNSSSSELYILEQSKDQYDSTSIILNEKPLVSVEKEILLQGIKKVQHAASKNVIKPEISSVFIHTKNKDIYFVSTDTHRVAISRFISEKTGDDGIKLLISIKNIQKIVKVLETIIDPIVNLYSTDDGIVIASDSITLKTSAIYGDFPNYEAIIPSTFDSEIILLKSDIQNFLKTSRLFTERIKIKLEKNEKKTNMLLRFENDKVGVIENSIPIQLKGSLLDIPSFNHKFISEALSVITDEKIVFSFQKDTKKPMVIKGTEDSSFMEIISPLIG